ncbi:hypothetical protein EHS25_008309 [Saitozyma podzolica]|uniref:Uncharacterized protein n=1 Tax=Saitozyma podzolica TaxID=1890683 RepID=A0A427YP44_9TREE|nr:hypothetical protein EHS25_008309 [Saitozyma podzolica]
MDDPSGSGSLPHSQIPSLPLEVLSHITSFLPPAFYPPQPLFPTSTSSFSHRPSVSRALPLPSAVRGGSPSPSPVASQPGVHQTHIIRALDPYPPDPSPPLHTLSSASKASHTLLSAARPWLWENVDVKSGRGWLAIVNALTEEVVDETENNTHEVVPIEGKFPGLAGVGHGLVGTGALGGASAGSGLGVEGLPLTSEALAIMSAAAAAAAAAQPHVPAGVPPTPMSPEQATTTTQDMQVDPVAGPGPGPAPDAHTQPNTVPGGTGRYISSQPSMTYPYPFPTGASSSSVQIAIPPQTYSYSPPQPPRLSMLLTPPGSRNASPHPNTTPNSVTVTSPRRGSAAGAGAPEGASSSIERACMPMSFEKRTSSLSRGKTRAEMWSQAEAEEPGDGDDEMTGDADEGSPEIRGRTMSPVTPKDTVRTLELADHVDHAEVDDDETWYNVNPELLPPPGPYIRHLSFTNFRTIGSRRTQDEAVRGRFVTAGRLEGFIKNAPNLLSVCMTEYVDSSLSLDVLEELLFRGQKRPRLPRRMSSTVRSLSRARSLSVDPTALLSPTSNHTQLDPPRPTYVPYEDETEEDKWRRRAMFTALEALDLTGCVSNAFTEGMRDLWDTWYAPDEGVAEEDDRDRGRSRGRARHRGEPPSSTETEEDEDSAWASRRNRSTSRRRTPVFPGMKRLSLRACLSLDSHIIDTFLFSFPCLTHLDLSNTKVSSSFLAALTERPPRSLQLQSLSLARCPRLDPFIVVDFLCRSPAAEDIVELNLFVNPSQGNAMRSDDLMRLVTTAPCFKSGQLRYLDLSSARVSAEHLAVGVFPAQPNLVSLGLSHISSLALPPIADFLLHSAPNVEILTLTGTAFETSLRPSATALQITLELHARLINPLTTVPFSLSSLHLGSNPAPPAPGPTKLRVIELSSPIRRAIGPEGGSHEWKVIRSKGGRGWYVDVSAGWVQDVKEDGREWRFARHLPGSDPWRRWLTGLCEASGRVSSSVGWHSRKMEVVRGMGMLGREEGMAGAGAFAFEE